MVSDHESFTDATETLRTPEQRRQDTLEDAAGVPVHRAHVMITGIDEDRPYMVQRSQQTVEASKKQRSRHSRRGGRSFNEGSDSEHDPYWMVHPEPLSPDQVPANHAAAAMIKSMLQEMQHDPGAEARHHAHLEEVRRRADAELNRPS